MHLWLLGLVCLTGCQGCTFPVPDELTTKRPAFTPAADFVGWVEALPRQPRPRTYFGCDLSLGPCNVAGLGLQVSVALHGDEATLVFLPSTFCDQVTIAAIPIDHFTRKPSLTVPLQWNDTHQNYEARGELAMSAPGADRCWEGSSVIFTFNWEIHASPLPPRKDWSAP